MVRDPSLKSYSSLIDDYDLVSVITNLKAYIWERILKDCKTSHKELEIFQSLIACFQTNAISRNIRTKLEKFKDECGSQSKSGQFLRTLMGTVQVEKSSTQCLQRFLQLVKNFESDYLLLENQLLELIRHYLAPIKITIKKIGSRSVVEVIGSIIYMSKQLEEVEKLLKNKQHDLIAELHFVAVHMLEIDCDLENSVWHGFNILVMAANVNVSENCKWDLSGLTSQNCYEKAQNGNSNDKDGKDGIDGRSGESSGNVMIIADQMQNAERLTVILNGGNGSNGQVGGDGANGEDGIGISMKDLRDQFRSPVRFWQKLYDLHAVYNKICSMGTAKCEVERP